MVCVIWAKVDRRRPRYETRIVRKRLRTDGIPVCVYR